MTAELGVFFLAVALPLALLQSSFLLPSAHLRAFLAPRLPAVSWMQALLVTLSFAMLMTLRLDSDFTVINVVAHSNLALPTLYKIAGTWGNHEGSMLLFALVMAGFGALLAAGRGAMDDDLRRNAACVQSLILSGILLFILFTSNPFARQFPPPPDGEALNPILQDIALALHPPLLYLGYVGFSLVFSLAVAGLLQRRIDRGWSQAAHPWLLASWSALTLGIGLGSWWAYRELGWGGWWFWDPVENASLLPWLAATTLLHANIVLKKRGLFPGWVALLSVLTFGMSLIGTFLVRSGALVSVHSFASDPGRGLFILAYMVVTIGGALLLFALRPPASEAETVPPVSREGLIVLNNLFLLTACATVLLGTTYPLLAEWISGDALSVGPPYFNATFLPLMVIPLLLAGLAPLVPWKKAGLLRVFERTRPAFLAMLVAVALVLAFAKTHLLMGGLGFGLAAWLAASSLQWLLAGPRRDAWPVFVGHLGVAVFIAGVTGVGLWKQEAERWVAVGDTIAVAGYSLTYTDESHTDTGNYAARAGRFEVRDARGRMVAALTPEYRTYSLRATVTSEAALHATLFSDLYAVIGEASPDGKRTAARIYWVPMIHFIWLGFMLMALSGLLSILKLTGMRREHAAV